MINNITIDFGKVRMQRCCHLITACLVVTKSPPSRPNALKLHIHAVIEVLLSQVMHRYQGCHWSGKSQGNSRSGKSQGILEFVREIWNFVGSQGNSRKIREI